MELSSIIVVSVLIVMSLITLTILASYAAFKFSVKRQFVQTKEAYVTNLTANTFRH